MFSGSVDLKCGPEGDVSDSDNWELGVLTQKWKEGQVRTVCEEAVRSLFQNFLKASGMTTYLNSVIANNHVLTT